MSAYKSDFLQVLATRGFIHQISEAESLDAKARAHPITAYVGFDATAPSLHIGNLLTIMMLRWLQKTGHRPIALGQGCQPHAAHERTDRCQYRLDRSRFLALSRLPGGRDHGEQC